MRLCVLDVFGLELITSVYEERFVISNVRFVGNSFIAEYECCEEDGIAPGEFTEWVMSVGIPVMRTGHGEFRLTRHLIDPSCSSPNDCFHYAVESDTIKLNILAINDSTGLKLR
jgi:hypothetical protein